jgi:hypothetical protein
MISTSRRSFGKSSIYCPWKTLGNEKVKIINTIYFFCRITELKLKPTTPTQDTITDEDLTTVVDLLQTEKSETETLSTPTTAMAVSEICWLESPNQELNPQLPAPAADVVSHVTAPPIQKAREFQKSMEDSSLASSICSTLDDIQPPSMMNSLISMSEKPSLPNSPRVSSKFECRHSSNKKLLTNSGHRLVPETVRTVVFCSQNCSDLL